MSQNNQIEPRKRFVPGTLPWVLGAVMLLVYVFTLNHWVTLANLPTVARVSGFMWQPEITSPLTFLFTSPFRLLPAAAVPLALNLFSAVCAALTLVVLARSVAILPQDRTDAQRRREKSDFAFLTTGSAWFPPVFAVLMIGLQFTFWENATSFTGESLNLLIFATIIWLLLEFRLDERPGRLTLAALIYGIGMTENWALIGFFPLFITAIIWLKGWEFFNLRFLEKMVLCGLAGMLFYLLLPVVGVLSSDTGATFWELLRPVLHNDWLVMKAVSVGPVRHALLLMSVTTLLPLLVMSIRWSATFGDSSRNGTLLVGQLFHIIHAVIFGACVWIMLDPPFSPGQLAMGSPALTFYYLAALAIGYYCGYFLLVFGKAAMPSRRNPRPDPTLPKPLDVFVPLIHRGTYAAAVIMVVTLVYKNFPFIRASNDDTLHQYAKLAVQSLPKEGGIVLSDSDSITAGQPTRALLVQAELARTGRDKDYLVVDTQSLNWAPYLRFLHKKSPDIWPEMVGKKDTGGVNPIGILSVLNLLSKSNTICYLNPSFGYYFEVFYQEPHGLVYRMKTLPADTLVPPPASTNLIAENQEFWAQVEEQQFPRIEKASAPYKPESHMNPVNWLIMHLHGQAAPNPNALYVANLYSRALNFWGVELQRAGQLPPAADCFASATKINSDNVVAGINLEFNRMLQSGGPVKINPDSVTADQFGKYPDWNAVLSANGPFDEPSFIFANASLLAQGGYMRQAIAPFARVLDLAPDNLGARLQLAQLYLFNRLPDPALQVLHPVLDQPKRFGLTSTNSTGLNVLASACYFQKNELPQGVALLEQEVARHPDDATLLTSAAQAFFMRGLYTNAMRIIDSRLAKTPDDPQWLFGKGYASLQMSNYNQAVTAFTRVLEISTNDPTARFNRALAYLQSDRLDKARADYLELQTSYTNSYQVAFGLAEVAWRQRNTNEAIQNYELYLTTAPTNSVESKTVRERLTQLRGQ